MDLDFGEGAGCCRGEGSGRGGGFEGQRSGPSSYVLASTDQVQASSTNVRFAAADSKLFLAAITRACKALIEAEPELTEQDRIAGDGDAGLTLEAGSKAILKAIDTGRLKGQNVIEDIGVLAEVVEEDMGGTSGALYSWMIPTTWLVLLADVTQNLLCWTWDGTA